MKVFFDYQFENISHPISVELDDVEYLKFTPAGIVIQSGVRFTDTYTHDRITSNIIVREE